MSDQIARYVRAGLPNLTMRQVAIMYVIARADDTHAKQVGRELQISKSAVCSTASRLANQGMVTVIKCDDGKHDPILRITDMGRETIGVLVCPEGLE